MNQDLLKNARFAAIEAANQTARLILTEPIYAEHALKIYLQGKMQVFEAALQAVRRATRTPSAPLHPAMVRLADQAARSIRWID